MVSNLIRKNTKTQNMISVNMNLYSKNFLTIESSRLFLRFQTHESKRSKVINFGTMDEN